MPSLLTEGLLGGQGAIDSIAMVSSILLFHSWFRNGKEKRRSCEIF